MELDGFSLGLLTNYEVRRTSTKSKHGHWRHKWVKYFLFLQFLGNGKEFLGEIFCIFRIFTRVSAKPRPSLSFYVQQA